MAITDLTGYTWRGNDTIYIPTESRLNFVLSFVANDRNFMGLGSAELDLMYKIDSTSWLMVYHEEWDEDYRTIRITGGTDVTNTDLIAWLEANGTLTPPTPPSSYTVHYYVTNSTIKVTADKVVDNVAVGSTITETAPTLLGYTLSSESPQSIVVSIDPADNIITFYYDMNIPQYLIGGITLLKTANAIRTKDGTTDTILAEDFPDRIMAIQTGAELTSLSIEHLPKKVRYFPGDYFNPYKMVIVAHYDNDSQKVLLNPEYPEAPLVDGQTGVVITYSESGVTKTVTVPITVSAMPNYFYLEALEDNDTAALTLNTGVTLEYSTDGMNFVPYNSDAVLVFNADQKIYFRGDNTTRIFSNASTAGKNITLTGDFNAGGNVMSLFDSTVQSTVLPANHALASMFRVCTTLQDCSELELPAETLTDYCYLHMFRGCTSITEMPELPATELTQYCYQDMFFGCTSLTTVKPLPATSLHIYCYSQMFYNCTALVTAQSILPARGMARYCYSEMFDGCTSLVNAPELPALALARYCYNYMFFGCTSLVTPPNLPARYLAPGCYYYMFRGCTSLSAPREMIALDYPDSACQSMFYSDPSVFKGTKTATDVYRYPYRIPKEGTGTIGSSPFTSMFKGTGSGGYVPTINQIFYLDVEPLETETEYHDMLICGMTDESIQSDMLKINGINAYTGEFLEDGDVISIELHRTTSTIYKVAYKGTTYKYSSGDVYLDAYGEDIELTFSTESVSSASSTAAHIYITYHSGGEQ